MTHETAFNHPWRDELGNDMDKAKAILANEAVTITFINNTTGINRMSLTQYRNGSTNLEKAKWETVTKLARAYEADWIQQNIGDQQTEFAQFIKEFTGKLTAAADQVEENDPEMGDTFDLLNDMTTSDIIQLITLYKNYISED